MPADIRKLAQEAVELAGKAEFRSHVLDLGTHESVRAFVRHAGTHYATIARALIEALDERDKLLAALPHALGSCGCVPLVQNRINVFGNDLWPEAHTAARERVEARIK